ncbi:MAG TPA: metallophosphoesterase [Verrucomicrobiae bacterium]|nr:metallophosphoesterase [Verrucomicrobiae bacterium]
MKVLVAGLFGTALSVWGANADITIAQLSDTHLGVKHNPDAAVNLRMAVEMINARKPDAVILSGDIGEGPANREMAKEILKKLSAPLYYVPGNHEIHSTNSLAAYRKAFGPDYYRFEVKGVEFLALDSQLLGNYGKFNGPSPAHLDAGMAEESRKMFDWMAKQQELTKGKIVLAVQHIPLFRDGNFPKPNPYWIVNEPFASRELDMFRKFGIKDLLAGHWHNGRVFERDGLTTHVAPSTSWLPLGGRLGFAMHAITAAGDVHTTFVYFPATTNSPSR